MVTGSWDRNTMTRYLKEGDVDVMVILNYGENKDWWSQPGTVTEGTIRALDRFKAILDEVYPDTVKRRDRNCITMQLSEFKLDVVPTYKANEGYYTVPDSVRKLWVKTNPIEFAKLITTTNKNMGGAFVPLIKMVKGWNRNVGWPIHSFHLECMMYEYYKGYTQAYTYDSMLRFFFASLPARLQVPCYDPVARDQVDTYLDNVAIKTNRQIAVEKASKAAQESKSALDNLNAGYEGFAVTAWKSLLGEFFPTYG